MASSFDQIGPIAKTVEERGDRPRPIRGRDPRDSTSMPTADKNFETALRGTFKKLRIGYQKKF